MKKIILFCGAASIVLSGVFLFVHMRHAGETRDESISSCKEYEIVFSKQMEIQKEFIEQLNTVNTAHEYRNTVRVFTGKMESASAEIKALNDKYNGRQLKTMPENIKKMYADFLPLHKELQATLDRTQKRLTVGK